jgi:hypothetical protein
MQPVYQWVGIVCVVGYSAVGIICLQVGGQLAVKAVTEEVEVRQGPPPPPPTTATVRKEVRVREHPANWGAAEGFAMSGGLCLIAAALAYRGLPTGQLAQGKANEAPAEQECSRAFRER